MSVKGYKVFGPDWKCRGFQYEVGKEYIHDGDIALCKAGFHFCEKLANCFSYYPFDPENHVAEVEAFGVVDHDENKSVTNSIRIVRELSWHEVLDLLNTGIGCTGRDNSGNYNSGDCNSGNYNSGDCNSGNYNSGDHNSGNYNSGKCNSGKCNSGNYNSGNYNSGYYNSGNYNSGGCNSGKYNSGDYNSGDYNSGNYNSGDYNSGGCNSGGCNSGNYNSGNGNSGNYNSGNGNSGNYNSGDCNSGNYNSGDCNSGNYNSGDHNSGNYNSTCFSSGFFNSMKTPIYAFDKPLNISRADFLNAPGMVVLSDNFSLTEWINFSDMSEFEKKDHPEAKTTNGYLKTLGYKDACKRMWNKLTEEKRKMVMEIPNFDPDVFEKITGIKVGEQNGES